MPEPKQAPQRDVVADLKVLRLHGMASAWSDLHEQGGPAAVESGRCGLYLRVVREGEARAGDVITLVERISPDKASDTTAPRQKTDNPVSQLDMASSRAAATFGANECALRAKTPTASASTVVSNINPF